MDNDLKNFLKHNDLPNEEIIPVVKELLCAGQQTSQEMQKEIQSLAESIEKVYEDYIELRTSLQDEEIIASPARRLLPSHILRRIFFHCLPTYRYPSMASSEAPMLLTAVCSSWRSVALSDPYLWSKIYITFTYSPPHMRGGTNLHNVEKMLKARCVGVRTWLGRSGSCPLSISIRHNGKTGWLRDRYHEVIENPNDVILDDTTQDLFEVVTALSHRWEEIELNMTSSLYDKFVNMISADSLVALRRTRISTDMEYLDEFDDEAISYKALKAPNLTVLSVNRILLLGPLPAPWSANLAYFSCFHHASVREVWDLLVSSPNLIHCSVTIIDSPFWGDGTWKYDTISDSTDVVVLPRLLSMSISSLIEEREKISRLLKHLNPPLLTDIKSLHPRYYGFDETQACEIDEPFPWLPTFNNLKIIRFNVDPRVLSSRPDELRDIFRALSSLTEFVIGQHFELSRTANHYESSSGRPTHEPRKNYNYTPIFSLLTVDSDSKKEILLPNLELFHASVNTQVSTDQIYKFVTSRLNSSSVHGVQVLKQVHIAIGRRESNRTLHDDIVSYGKKVGACCSGILIQYISNNYSTWPFSSYSPGFGLINGVRSWRYADDIVVSLVSTFSLSSSLSKGVNAKQDNDDDDM
uniref:F-box domain-containing protein n=1 Tax=Psilocybe cubensis TaxID=181762 RepID=A0A8H7XN84_PSICU